MAKAEIKNHNGSPALFIDGKVYPPMTALIRTRKFDEFTVDADYYKALGESGIKVFYIVCDTLWLASDAVEKFNEEAEILLDVVPDAYIIPRISLHPTEEWMKSNPDEIVSYSDGRVVPTKMYMETFQRIMDGMYSLCSEKWRKDAGCALMETIAELMKLPCAQRIAGFFLCAGGTSEWYYINPLDYPEDGAYGDFSKSFRTQFEKYLKEKYGENHPEPTIPPAETRFYASEIDKQMANPGRIYASDPAPAPVKREAHTGSFLDVDNHMHTYDFYRAWHLGTADSIIYFSKLIKEKYPQFIVGAFYGSWGWSERIFASNAGGVMKLLESPYVDALANPGVYENRQPGGFTGQRQMPDSYRLHNSLYIVEEDTRTHAENTHFGDLAEMFTIEDTINVLKRDFGRNVCEDLQAWWFDQHISGGRYKYPEVYELFARQQEIAHESYSMTRTKNSEIAFIYDEESLHVVSDQTTDETVEIIRGYDLARIGAPVDQYYHNDMANPNMPDYKLYVFCNTFMLSDEERSVIHAKLRKNNATALFLYAPGIINPDSDTKLCAGNIENLTGIECVLDYGKTTPAFKRVSPELAIEENKIYGLFEHLQKNNISNHIRHPYRSYLYPAVFPRDEKAEILARFCQNGEGAVAVKENNGFTSVLCGAKYVNHEFLKAIAKMAGCHLYEENANVVYANRNYITVHHSHTGKIEIKLPRKADVWEVYENKCYGTNTDVITYDGVFGETKMFRLK